VRKTLFVVESVARRCSGQLREWLIVYQSARDARTI
jgi:hypothetical protein